MKNITWYHNLGFASNPFSIKASAFHNELFGNDKTLSKIKEKMLGNGMIFISGEFGTGKTSVLKKLICEFPKRKLSGKRIIYYNCNQSDLSIKYDRLIVKSGNTLQKIFKIKRKNLILFLDEMQDMSQRDLEEVKNYYEQGFFKLIIFASKYEDVKLGDELEELIGENKFKLKNMSAEEAIKMVRKRIGDLNFLSNEMVVKIFEYDQNARSFLKNCEDVCKYSFEKGNQSVTLDCIRNSLK